MKVCAFDPYKRFVLLTRCQIKPLVRLMQRWCPTGESNSARPILPAGKFLEEVEELNYIGTGLQDQS